MINRYLISVRNVSNDKIHFQRCVELPDDVVFPYEQVNRSLLFLFSPLDIYVDVSCHSYNQHMSLKNG